MVNVSWKVNLPCPLILQSSNGLWQAQFLSHIHKRLLFSWRSSNDTHWYVSYFEIFDLQKSWLVFVYICINHNFLGLFFLPYWKIKRVKTYYHLECKIMTNWRKVGTKLVLFHNCMSLFEVKNSNCHRRSEPWIH